MARIKRDEIDRFHEMGIYVPKRTIYLGSEQYDMENGGSGVDGLLTEKIIKNLSILDTEPYDPITIIINNEGGTVYDGLGIYDFIKGCKSHVTMIAYGQVMSMGSVIFQAADERIMAPNATQMIHYGSMKVEGDSKAVQAEAREDARLNRIIEEIYLEKIRQTNPNFKLSRLKQLLSTDTYLTAQESVNIGLADKVLGEK